METQNEILSEILERQHQIEELQAEINEFVEKNKNLPENEKDIQLTDCINSYQTF